MRKYNGRIIHGGIPNFYFQNWSFISACKRRKNELCTIDKIGAILISSGYAFLKSAELIIQETFVQA